MNKTCNFCGSKLLVAFEQLGQGNPYYLAFCSGFFRCKSVAWDISGKGDTQESAIDDYHKRSEKAFVKREPKPKPAPEPPPQLKEQEFKL